MAAIGLDARQNMLNIALHFKEIVESNIKFSSKYGVRIKEVKTFQTDVDNRKVPGTRTNMTVHTLSVSLIYKPKINLPQYEFDYKTDIGNIGFKMTSEEILSKLKMFQGR